MRIRKTSVTTNLPASVVNTQSDSQTNTYSCDYLNDKINTQQITTANTNANDYKTTGVYFFTNAYLPTNAPSGTSNGWLQVIELSNTAVKQIWHNRTQDNRMYIRVAINATTWSDWKEIAPGDTGWIEIKQSDLVQGTVVTGYYVPAYRKIGKVVYLKGQINGVTSRATEIFTLPSGYYNPDARLNFCSTNDAMNVNFIRITNAGVVVLQRSDGDFTQGINVYLDDIKFLVD